MRTKFIIGLLAGLLFSGAANACCGGDVWLADDNDFTGDNTFVGISASGNISASTLGVSGESTLTGGFKIGASGATFLEYEEDCGGFTPSIYGGTNPGNLTPGVRQANCIVMGKAVIINYRFVNSGSDPTDSPTGTLKVDLPPSHQRATGDQYISGCLITYMNGFTHAAANYIPQGLIYFTDEVDLYALINTAALSSMTGITYAAEEASDDIWDMYMSCAYLQE